ncbi:MAG: phosphatase PAP2 family protein [Dehalococcoidia bacterium]
MALHTLHTETTAPRLHLPRPSTWMAAAALGVLFLALMIDALIHGRAVFDLAVLRAVQGIDAPFLEDVLHPIDRLTSTPGAITMWVLVVAVLVAARWWLPAFMLLALPVGGVINETIGALTSHVRPAAGDVERFVNTQAPSFPSGHVAGAVLLYGFLFVIADRIGNGRARIALKVASLGVIVAVGFGRLWYGAHWPSDVIGAYALGTLMLWPLVIVYRRLDGAVGRLPLIRAAVPRHNEALPHAHALTSLVTFDGDSVTKQYAPGLLPRALYWAAFQAEFPYIRNEAALEAAMHRRNLAAQLTEYWYGGSRVARVTGIEQTADGYAIRSDRVEGRAPVDKAAAKAFLRDLRGRFEEAGLPTWQIDPRQPRAVDNLLMGPDGVERIVDLESGLVAPIASLKTWGRGLRRGQVPLYDDVFFDITRAYVAREEAAMRGALGDRWVEELLATLDAAEATAAAWHESEPRLFGRLLRGVQHDWPAWVRARLSGSQEKAQEWLGRAVDTWEREGRVTAAEAEQMRAHMNGAEFQAMLPHLGAHIVISIILRFPFGSIARAAWSAGALLTATARLLLRRIDGRAWKQAWSIHSPLVIVLSAVPGFGTFAYLAAKPVRSNRLLLRATADAALKKAPWRLYERSRLHLLVSRPAGSAVIRSVEAGAARPESWLVPQAGFVAAMVGDQSQRTGLPPLRVIPGGSGGLPLTRTGAASGEPARSPAA